MLRVKAHQIEHFASEVRRKFVAKTTTYLKTEFDWVVRECSQDELDEFVNEAIDRASAHRIHTEPDVMQLLLLYLLLGLEMEVAHPWAHEALSNHALVAEGKIRALIKACRREAVANLDYFVIVPPYAA